MPRCESCGSIVSKSEITFNPSYERTSCSRCTSVGSVFDEPVQINLRITSNGIEFSTRSDYEYKASWSEVKYNLRRMRKGEPEIPPINTKLRAVGEQ
jgi:hypothetical protein